ncbi:MAG: hypothetical protein QW318_07190, partial [Candidatus Caldarchaeum sp.]
GSTRRHDIQSSFLIAPKYVWGVDLAVDTTTHFGGAFKSVCHENAGMNIMASSGTPLETKGKMKNNQAPLLSYGVDWHDH